MIDTATLEAINLRNFDGHRRAAPWPQRRAKPSHLDWTRLRAMNAQFRLD
jgi:hypothetical protein